MDIDAVTLDSPALRQLQQAGVYLVGGVILRRIPEHGVGRPLVLAGREIEAFSRRLGGHVALPALTPDLTALMGRPVAPSYVLWIHGDP